MRLLVIQLWAVKFLKNCESIGELESLIKTSEVTLSVANDPNVSLSSANPNQHLTTREGNQRERTVLRGEIYLSTRKLANRKGFIYHYVLQKHYELKFS